MKVLVCGSRGLRPKDYRDVFDRLLRLSSEDEIIHGGARGVDRFAGACAEAFGNRATVFLAEWDRHGKQAGVLRNCRMLDENPDVVLAFWDGQSRGTKHTIDEATRRGIPVEVLP